VVYGLVQVNLKTLYIPALKANSSFSAAS
jgi:hypothetical protein